MIFDNYHLKISRKRGTMLIKCSYTVFYSKQSLHSTSMTFPKYILYGARLLRCIQQINNPCPRSSEKFATDKPQALWTQVIYL